MNMVQRGEVSGTHHTCPPSVWLPRAVRQGVAAGLSLLLIGGIAQESDQANSSYTYVQAEITTPEDGEVTVALSSERVKLTSGTLVTALCREPDATTLRVAIQEGPYEGNTADFVPRPNLMHLTDPFGADQQSPPQDPFGPIEHC